MSVWLDGPIAGPLADGDLCEASEVPGHRCDSDAVTTAEDLRGRHVLLCYWHAERHGLTWPWCE